MTQILSPSSRRRNERARVQRICAVAALVFTCLLILPLFVLNLSRNEKSNSNAHRQLEENNILSDETTPTTILDPDFLIEPDLTKHDGTKKQQQNLRKRRLLPSFENGGVIIFFNIAASGGLAIREYVQTRQKKRNDIAAADDDSQSDYFTIRTERMYNPDTAVQYENEILKELTTKPNDATNKTILFVEIAGDVPGFVYWQRKLNRFRELATVKSFFSFTILREPVSYHTNYFNMFQLHPCVDGESEDNLCENNLVQPSDVTENIFIDRSIPNHQCLWLARLSHNPYRQDSCVTNEECRGTYSYMKDHLDWIGITEEIQSVTIPLLSHLMSSNDKELRKLINPDEIVSSKAGLLEVTKISNGTSSSLLVRSAGDAEVYNAVKRDYDINNFFYNYDPMKIMLAQS